jgi:uncharacterized protein
MSRDDRYVFDTNVLISAALLPDSVPGHALLQCLERGTNLISQSLVEELSDVLSRKRFDRFVTRDERERILAALINEADLIEVTERIEVCRDPKDDHVLELAVNGKAKIIVSGDQELLVLNPFRDVPIVTPAELLDRFSGESLDVS